MAKNKNNKVWDPEYRYQAIKGQFVDYRGEKRDYTMVAVSVPFTDVAQFGFLGIRGTMPVEKLLVLGVAVRCNRDADNGMGERIAYGKALKKMDHTVMVSHAGLINTTMVGALLQQEAAFFEKDPGMYIAGYNSDKRRFEESGRVAPAELSEDELPSNDWKKSVYILPDKEKPVEADVIITQEEKPVTTVVEPTRKTNAKK